jgi:hypothetical protein
MKRNIYWLVLISLLGLCALAAYFVAPVLGLGFKLTLLVCLVVAYLVLAGIVLLQRSHLRSLLEDLPPEAREALGRDDTEIRYALPKKTEGFSARTATLVGAFAINGLVIPLLVGPLFVSQYIFGIHAPLVSFFCLVLGFVLAWTWWSVGVTVWRQWAARRGVDPEELQWRGENATLLWPKGHFLEKTEFGRLWERRKK